MHVPPSVHGPGSTAAVIDRLVHHSVVIELAGESYRVEHASQRAKAGLETAKSKRGKHANNGN